MTAASPVVMLLIAVAVLVGVLGALIATGRLPAGAPDAHAARERESTHSDHGKETVHRHH